MAPKQVLINTLQEILTSDLTRIGQLAGKAAMDAVRPILAAWGGTPRSCVRRGLEATIAGGGTLPVTIGTGELLTFDAGVDPIADDDSDLALSVLGTAFVSTRTAADVTDPRVDVIYATIASADEDATSRNQLVLPGRTWAPASLATTRIGRITIACAEGTPSATPAWPSIPAGAVPLWGVYVPAGASAILDDHLIDMRVYWSTLLGLDECRVLSGLTFERSALGDDQVVFKAGAARINGALLESTLNRNYLVADVLAAGETFAAGQQLDAYVIAKGNGVPVGKTVPEGFVPLATGAGDANPPTTSGRPDPVLSFGPLAFAASNAVPSSVLSYPTDRALYVGTLHVDSGAASITPTAEFTGSPPLDRAGQLFLHAADVDGGRFPAHRGWTKQGRLSWTSATQASLSGCDGIIDGTPFTLVGPIVFDMTANLGGPTALYPGGEVESASTWYYLYLRKAVSTRGAATRRGPIRELIPIISKSAPTAGGFKNDPETGFTWDEYLYVGSIYNDASNDIAKFRREGNMVVFNDAIHTRAMATINTAPSDTPITPKMPSTSAMAIVQLDVELTSSGAGLSLGQVYVLPLDSGTEICNTLLYTLKDAAGAGVLTFSSADLHVPTKDQTFRLSKVLSVNAADVQVGVWTKGYVESIEATVG